MRVNINFRYREFLEEVKRQIQTESDGVAVDYIIASCIASGILESSRYQGSGYIRVPVSVAYFILGLLVAQEQQQRRSNNVSALLRAVAQLEEFP